MFIQRSYCILKPWLVIILAVFLAASELLSSINIGRIEVAIVITVAEVIARIALAATLNSVSLLSSLKSTIIRQVGRSDIRLFGKAL